MARWPACPQARNGNGDERLSLRQCENLCFHSPCPRSGCLLSIGCLCWSGCGLSSPPPATVRHSSTPPGSLGRFCTGYCRIYRSRPSMTLSSSSARAHTWRSMLFWLSWSGARYAKLASEAARPGAGQTRARCCSSSGSTLPVTKSTRVWSPRGKRHSGMSCWTPAAQRWPCCAYGALSASERKRPRDDG